MKEPKKTKFCIYCGKTLVDGEICSCKSSSPADIAAISEASVEPLPTKSPEPAPAKKTKFCIYCGKTLKDGKACKCKVSKTASESPIESKPESTPVPIHETVSISEPVPVKKTKFCIYCGKTLMDGKPCKCKATKVAAESTPTPVAVSEPEPVPAPTPAPTPAPPKKPPFCIYCGKLLPESGICPCRAPAPVEAPPVPAPTPTPAPTSSAPAMYSAKLKSTMRPPAKPVDPATAKAIKEGQSFFNKSTDLD